MIPCTVESVKCVPSCVQGTEVNQCDMTKRIPLIQEWRRQHRTVKFRLFFFSPPISVTTDMGNVIRLPPPNDHGAPYPRHGNTVNQNQKKQDSTTLLSIRYNHGRLPVIPGVGSYGTTWFQQTSKEHTSIASTSSLALGPCATPAIPTLKQPCVKRVENIQNEIFTNEPGVH